MDKGKTLLTDSLTNGDKLTKLGRWKPTLKDSLRSGCKLNNKWILTYQQVEYLCSNSKRKETHTLRETYQHLAQKATEKRTWTR
jgi:hypothetical protein